MRQIILITGGARSGKSTYAEKLALSLSPNPVYLATARIWDEEFRKRVIHHQERRGPEWTNIEEDKELSRHSLSGRTVLIDCITLWCTNFFFDLDADTDRSLAAAKGVCIGDEVGGNFVEAVAHVRGNAVLSSIDDAGLQRGVQPI